MFKKIFKVNTIMISKSRINFIGNNNIFAIIFIITPPSMLNLIIDINMSVVNIK